MLRMNKYANLMIISDTTSVPSGFISKPSPQICGPEMCRTAFAWRTSQKQIMSSHPPLINSKFVVGQKQVVKTLDICPSTAPGDSLARNTRSSVLVSSSYIKIFESSPHVKNLGSLG